MTPTSPSTPDALPPEVAAVLGELSGEERASLKQTWHLTGHAEAPPVSAARKQATWDALQRQIAPASRRSFADRAPMRGFRHSRLRPALATCAVLVAAVLLAWPLAFPPSAPSPQSWQAADQITPVHLPDGSVVQLDPGATLLYRGERPEERIYSLVGTATFEVARDEGHPFQVQTQRVGITVLGTVFRIAAENADGTRVEVHEGRVAVSTPSRRVEAGRGEQVITAETDGPLVVKPLPSASGAVFAFHDAPLSEVLREVEVLFGTHVSYPASLANERITITRHGPLDVNELLQSVCAPLRLRYHPTPAGFEVSRAR